MAVLIFQAFQQELESRQTVFMAMQASQSNDSSIEVQLDDLNALWTRVNQLCEVREARLQEALKLVSVCVLLFFFGGDYNNT